MANLLIDILRSYANLKEFKVHDFVIMPNHLHLLLTVENGMSIEKAVQLIKGNFSYRAKKELGYVGHIWQRGFSEIRILDRKNFLIHRQYIYDNPVKAGLADSADRYPYGSAFFRARRAGAKAQS